MHCCVRACVSLLVLVQPASAFMPQSLLTSRTTLPLAAGRRSITALRAEVITVGDALFDCIAETDTAGWELEKVLEEERWTAWPGGAPANVATALRKLGTASGFAGCIGADADGDELAELFESIGVETKLLQRSADAPTRRVVVTRDAGMVPTFACFVNKRPANEFADCLFDLTPETLPPATLDAGLDGCRWICSSTLSLAFPKSQRSVRHLVDAAVEKGARKFVDINWRDVFWPEGMEDFARDEILDFAKDADVIKLTDEEAEWLFQIEPSVAFSDPKQVHEKFPGAKAVLITSGENGVSYSMLGQEGSVPAFKVDVVETTGAGDAFTAGFLHGVLAMDIDFDMFETLVPKTQRPLLIQLLLTFAVAVAGLTCTGEGAIAPQPSYEAVASFMEEYEATRRTDEEDGDGGGDGDEGDGGADEKLEELKSRKVKLGEWKPRLG